VALDVLVQQLAENPVAGLERLIVLRGGKIVWSLP
jgi:hypothetical protein